MRRVALCILALVGHGLLGRPALAQDDDDLRTDTISANDWVTKSETTMAPWATDFLDPSGYTRLHATTRATFTDGQSAFSSASTWALEGRAHFDFGGGFSGHALVPFAIIARDLFGTDIYFGNVQAGVSFGALAYEDPQFILRWAVGLDATAPTAARPGDPGGAVRHSLVAAIRGRAPQLYVPRLGTVHARGHTDLQWRSLTVDFELGVMPGYTLGAGGTALLLLSTQARVAWSATPAVEPYLELGVVRQIAGAGSVQPPLWVTPGVRFNINDFVHPSVFLSMNFEDATALVFGVDFAGLFRPRPKVVDPDAMDEFLQDDDW